MKNQSSFNLLLERINSFYHSHGEYPKVRISRAFWEEYAHEIANLSKDGIAINVVDKIRGRHSFLLDHTSPPSPAINTLLDLKEQVDTWVEQGRGAWPVRCMATEADAYIPIQLFAIVPGEAPMEGIDLFEDFADAPEGEHILVITGE